MLGLFRPVALVNFAAMPDYPGLISKALSQPLPGQDVQYALAPAGRREQALKPLVNEPRLSAVLLLLYPQDGHWYFPLMRRPANSGLHAGQISFPGGKVEKEDASFEQTALREAKEEMGIVPDEVALLGQLTDIYIPPSNFKVHPIIGHTQRRPDFSLEPAEVEELIEVPVSRLLENDVVQNTEITTSSGLRLQTPYLNLNQQIVWGATGMMLNEFRALLSNALSEI